MAFPNFLGELPPPGSSPGFAGGHFGGIDQMGGINNALAQNAMRPAPQQKKQGIGLMDILGIIGDALLVGNGASPIAAPYRMQQRERDREQGRQDQINAALANYMDDPEGAIRALMGIDAQAGISLLNSRQKDDRPGIIREADAYADLSPEERSQVDSYLKLRFPGAMSPIVMGENDSLEMPGQSEPQEAIAEDANGNRIRYNPQSGAWEPLGGQTANPSGVFPR